MGNRKENIEKNTNIDETDTNIAVVEETQEQSPQEAPAVHGIEPKNDKVVVCLKHPQGIEFLLENKSVVIKGNASHLKGLKTGILPDGGFGMTTINKEDWEYIKKIYGGLKIFKSGLIFAATDIKSAEQQSKEYDEIQSGLEPIVIGENTSVAELKKVKEYRKDT